MSDVKIKNPKLVACFLIAAAVFCLYSISIGHNFLSDEDDIILLNPLMRDLSSIPKLFTVSFFQPIAGVKALWEQYYRPLTSITFLLDYQIWKVNPLGYNLTNTALHILVSLLLFKFLFRIFNSSLIAFLSALLFAVHPIHTEAVTYIASRGDLLGGVFLLSILILYWKGRYWPAICFYFISLFAKESALLIPVYLVLLEICFIRTPVKKLVRRVVPFFMIAVSYVLFRKFLAPVPLGPPDFNPQESALRFLSMAAPFLSYLKAIFFPESFKFCEAIEFASSFKDPRIWSGAAVFISMTTLWVLTLRRGGAVFFGMSLFLFAMAPSLQIIHLYPEWAEHYLYISSMGLVILMGCLLQIIISKKSKALFIIFLTLYLPFLGFVSMRTAERNYAYQDTERYYWTLARSASPYAYYGYVNLGIMAVMKGDWRGSFVPFNTAYLINPDSESNNFNLGMYYFKKRQYEKSVDYFRTAYTTHTGMRQPLYYMNAGVALMRLERYDEAIEVFQEVRSKIPAGWVVYRNLGRAHLLAGNSDEAAALLEQGLELVKNSPRDHAALLLEAALQSYMAGQDDRARLKLEELASRYPSLPWYGEAASFLTGKTSREEYETVIQTKYPYNAKDSRLYMLMSHVLREEWRYVTGFLKKYKKHLERSSDDILVTKRFLHRAEQALAKASFDKKTGL